jgi:hypothetical protein
MSSLTVASGMSWRRRALFRMASKVRRMNARRNRPVSQCNTAGEPAIEGTRKRFGGYLYRKRSWRRSRMMGHGITRHLRPQALIVALAGAALFFPASAEAGMRFGPGAVLGLVAGPLRMMTQGIGGAAGYHRHAAHAQPAHVQHTTPSPTAVAVAAPSPPAEPPVVEARAETAHATETARLAEPSRPAASQLTAGLLAWPVASPSVYEDLLGYVLLPGDYSDRLWGHGYGDLMNALLIPDTAANADQTASMIHNGMCSQEASELADRLVARTGELIAPTPEQKAALDELRSGLGEAIARGRAAICTGIGDPLHRTVDGLWTMWDATLLMRAPLEDFYGSLTPAQRVKLTGGIAAGKALARACAEHSADWPGDRIAQALGPDQQQRLEALRQQSSALTKLLAASCPRQTEATPMHRLTAAGNRMNALLYVVMSLSPALSELQSPPGGPSTAAADH